MQSSDIIRQLQAATGFNASDLAQASGLSESLISRALHGKNDPSFSKIANAAERLGYRLTLSPLEQATVQAIGTRMNNLIAAINQHASDEDSWSSISIKVRELLEFPDAHPSQPEQVIARMPNDQWRAFIGGLYRYKRWPICETMRPEDLRLPQQWSPLRKIYRSMTAPDPSFLEYNVYVPSGELQWT